MEKKENCSICDRLFEDIDKERIRRSVDRLREEFPTFTRQALCRLIIEREATFCGAIGGLTGALPWPWLILGAAPDMIALLVKQSQMILSIAYIYGCEPDSRERMLEILGCLGTSAGAVAGTYGIRRLVERGASKALAELLFSRIFRSMMTRVSPRLVPLIGAATGIAFNQASVWAVGKIAIEYYKYYKMPSQSSQAPDESDGQELEEESTDECEDTEPRRDEEELREEERLLEKVRLREEERLQEEEGDIDDGSGDVDVDADLLDEIPSEEDMDDERGEQGGNDPLDTPLTDDEVRDLLESRADSPENRQDDEPAEREKESEESDADNREPQGPRKKKITRISLDSDDKGGDEEDKGGDSAESSESSPS